jgi:hypothetical protein
MAKEQVPKKELVRRQHPQYGQRRIECAHIKDSFLGGTNDLDNLKPLSIPEHLVDHVTKAEQATDWEIARRQYSAARLIAYRATPEEIEEANQMLASMPKRRRV